jgi:hypothetical protein
LRNEASIDKVARNAKDGQVITPRQKEKGKRQNGQVVRGRDAEFILNRR